MATLQGRFPKDTYKDLLQISNGNSGIDATLRTIEDGEGTSGSFQISTTGFRVLATATFDGASGATINLANFTFAGTWDVNGSTWDNVNIDSGAIDGTPIGANAASTAAFTTLSTTGDFSAGGDIKFAAGSDIMSQVNTDNVILSGGNTTAIGGNVVCFGGAEASTPDEVLIRNSSTVSVTFHDDQSVETVGDVGIGVTPTSANRLTVEGDGTNGVANFRASGGTLMFIPQITPATGENAANAAMKVRKDSTTSRSINAAGTINASGADTAEYMTKSSKSVEFNKGDLVGIDNNGKLTNIYDDAHTIMIKSSDPHTVGGDKWGSAEALGMEEPILNKLKLPTEPIKDKKEKKSDFSKRVIAWEDRLEKIKLYNQKELEIFTPLKAEFDLKHETARQKVDRIAYSGRVPVNLEGNAGEWLIPVKNEDGKIDGAFVSQADLTFEQMKTSIGKAFKNAENGKTLIAVGIK